MVALRPIGRKPTGPLQPQNGSAQVNDAVRKFLVARENARRFHKGEIGNVDPDHCFGHWLSLVGRGDWRGIAKEYGKTLAYVHSDHLDATGVRSKAAMSASTGGPSGGYLVPPELAIDLMGDVGEESLIRPRAMIAPMTSSTLDLPYIDATTTTGTSGVPTFFGGIQMSFLSEAQARKETEPKFRNVSLKAWDLSGYAVLSNTMQADSYGLDAWLRKLFARSIGWFEDYFFMQGTGVGQPLGFLNAAASLVVNRTGGVNKVVQLDIATMDTDLLPHSFVHAIWLATVSAMVQILQISGWVPNQSLLADPKSGGEGGTSTRSAGLLQNRPLYATEKLPALGTKGDLMLVDPSLYVIGDRMAVEIATSTEWPTVFPNYQTAWRVLERVDGQPVMSKTMTLQEQGTVVSPYVVLN